MQGPLGTQCFGNGKCRQVLARMRIQRLVGVNWKGSLGQHADLACKSKEFDLYHADRGGTHEDGARKGV